MPLELQQIKAEKEALEAEKKESEKKEKEAHDKEKEKEAAALAARQQRQAEHQEPRPGEFSIRLRRSSTGDSLGIVSPDDPHTRRSSRPIKRKRFDESWDVAQEGVGQLRLSIYYIKRKRSESDNLAAAQAFLAAPAWQCQPQTPQAHQWLLMVP